MRVSHILRIILATSVMLDAVTSVAIGDSAAKYYDVKLYAPKPPAGSSYVRVMNAGSQRAVVAIGDSKPFTLTPAGGLKETFVTPYHLVQGGRNVVVSIGAGASTSVAISPDRYVTLIARQSANGSTIKSVLDDPGADANLLAQLRVYNLIPGCRASLSLRTGQTVFQDVGSDESKTRSINPVAAMLIPKCGDAAGKPVPLPLLKAHDHFTFAIVGGPHAPTAVGALDVTESSRE